MFNEKGDAHEIYPHRWEIIKHIKVVPRPWRVHEEIQAKQVEKVSRGMERVGYFIAPVIGSYYKSLGFFQGGREVQGNYTFIADGTHRTGAAQALGFNGLPILDVDYSMDKRVELYPWIRTLRRVDPKRFSAAIDSFNQKHTAKLVKLKREELKALRRDMDRFTERTKLLEKTERSRRKGHLRRSEKLKDEIKELVRSLKIFNELTVVYNRRFYRPSESLDHRFRGDKLSQYSVYCLALEEEFKLQKVFESQIKLKSELEAEYREGKVDTETYQRKERALYDIYINPIQAISQLLEQRRFTLIPPPLEKREVFEIARKEKYLPVHSTRHTFDTFGPVRVFGTHIALDRLRNIEDHDALTREVQDELYELGPEEIHWYPNGGRLDREYRHPVIIFNVSKMRKDGKDYGLLM